MTKINREEIFIALPDKYPQTHCGVVGCKKKLEEENNCNLTSAICNRCAKNIKSDK